MEKVTLESIEEEVLVSGDGVDTDLTSLKNYEEEIIEEENTHVPVVEEEEVEDDISEDIVVTKPSINPVEELDIIGLGSLGTNINKDLIELTGIGPEEDSDTDRAISVAKDYFKPKKIDISDFIVSDKVVDLVTLKSEKNHMTSEWVLPNSGKKISMTEFSGFDLDILNSNSRGRKSKYNAALEKYDLIYNHIVHTQKPENSLELLKLIPFSDLDSIYFAIYLASFSDHKGMIRHCEKCNHIYIEDIEPENLYEFTSEEEENKFFDILEGVVEDSFSEQLVNRVTIGDKYAVDLKIPTIYDIAIEPSVLPDDFFNQYTELIPIIPYIKDIYKIDIQNKRLDRVNFMIGRVTEKSPEVDKLKAKILVYGDIITKMSSLDISQFNRAIYDISEMEQSTLSYVLPETNCEKCNAHFEKTETTGSDILFTIHHLAKLANS